MRGLCSYETVKYVQIQDARLGWLRATLLIGIFGYVAIYEMWMMGGYLESTPVVGVIRFSVRQPTVDNCDPSDVGCLNAFESVETLPYCSQRDENGGVRIDEDIGSGDDDVGKQTNELQDYRGEIYPCEIYEAVNAQAITETSVVVLTRASTREEVLVCGGSGVDASSPMYGNGTCPRTYEVKGSHDSNDDTEKNFYIAQSEAFTILLDHAVTASKICKTKGHRGYSCSSQSSQYKGRLLSKNENLCEEQAMLNQSFSDTYGTQFKNTAPCYIQPNKTATDEDFFSLDVLLQASGLNSLDDCISNENGPIVDVSNDGSDEQTTCKTYRESGATLLLNIYWNDLKQHAQVGARSGPHYTYVPQLVGTSYKQSIPFYEHYRTDRTLLRAHGVKIAVLLGGEFHQFQLLSFMITLTTALGLLAVATTIVDSLMLYVLPEKDRYQQVKYEQHDGFEPSSNENAAGTETTTATFTPPIVSPADEESTLNQPLLFTEQESASGGRILSDVI